MHLQGEQLLPGPPHRVWDLLMDPDVLVATMPGCERLERVDDERYRGTIEARIGPVTSRFDATFRVYDTAPPTRYRLRIEGRGRGGSIRADTHVTLRAQDGGTMMHYDADAEIGGAVALAGRRLVESVAKMMIAQGFRDLHAAVEERLRSGDAGEG